VLLEALDAPEKNEVAARHLKEAMRVVRVPMVRMCVGLQVCGVGGWVDVWARVACLPLIEGALSEGFVPVSDQRVCVCMCP
jgi:hypothetical protein